jgi:hypothetical protein
MKTLYKGRLMGTILGFCLLIGLGVSSAVTAQAQWPNDQWRRQQQYEREQLRRQREWERQQRRQQRNGYGYGYGVSSDLRQTALNAGYNEGIKEGRKDRSHNDRFEYRDEGDYQNATIDYSSRLGNRELYRQYFRQGFANGYRDGYGGY